MPKRDPLKELQEGKQKEQAEKKEEEAQGLRSKMMKVEEDKKEEAIEEGDTEIEEGTAEAG